MGLKIVSLISNWMYTHEHGEECEIFEVGETDHRGNLITAITEYNLRHPLNNFGKPFFDVDFGEGKTRRIFNFNSVSYEVK